MHDQGHIYFWKYKTDEIDGEWHATADAKGCSKLKSIHRLLAAADAPMAMDLPLSPVDPSILELPNYNSPHKSMTHLALRFDPGSAAIKEWRIVENNGVAEIRFGKAMLGNFGEILSDPTRRSPGHTFGWGEDFTLFVWDLG